MIYANDRWAQIPIMQLYDTGLMQSAINNARYMYDKAEKRMDDFYEKYGEFMSPFQRDMDRYNQIVGNVKSVVDNLYAMGEDPLRTKSGRAKMMAAMRSVNPGEIANMRTNAKLGFEYLKNIEEAKAKDQFSQEFEDYLLTHGGPGMFSDFSSAGGKIWNRPGPGRYQTVDDLIEPIVKNVDYTFDEAMTKQHNDGNNYYSITRDRLAKAVDDNMSDILATQSGGFHYWKAMEAAKALGGDEEMGKKIFRDMISNRLSDHEKIKFEADPFRLDDYRTKNDIRAHSAKAAIDYRYKHMDDPDPTDNKQSGYNIAEDVYVTSLAKGAGVEYLSQGGVDPNWLAQTLKQATIKQRTDISHTHDVFASTGAYISKDKIDGLIQSDGRNGNGHFLSSGHFKNLHDLKDIATSYKGYVEDKVGVGMSAAALQNTRKKNKEISRNIVSELRKVSAVPENKKEGYRVKVVAATDKNGYNTYSFVGDDNKWHTYALVRVYMSNGKETKGVGNKRYDGNNKILYDVPQEGKLMALEVGLHSNEDAASPDLSVSAREDLGFYGYDATKKKIGMTGNTGFPYGTNKIK